MAESKRRIVILGKTGAGKSSLANTIFKKKKLFSVGHGFKSVTSVCGAKTRSVNGRKLTLIDSPGFFDTNSPEEELKQEIVRCITECSPGPHAFLIVLKVERFTTQEEEIIHRMTECFSEEVYKYATVVFTHGDDLPEGETIKDLVKENKPLGDFVEKCGGRCHVIDNKHWNNPEDKYRSNEYQVKEILKSIDKTVETNNGNCYTTEMLQEVEQMIQEEEKRIAESSENMSEEEIRTEAKQRVITYLNKAAGITAGALLGAFFGVVLPGALVTAGLVGVVEAAVSAARKAIASGAVGAGTVRAAGAAGAGAAAVGAGAVGAAGAAGAGAGAGAGAVGAGAGAVGAAGAAGAGAAAVGAGAVGAAGAAGAGEAVAAEAVAVGAGAGAAGIAGGVVVGVLAAVGAGFGGYEGYQAAKEAETPKEAAIKAAKAVCSKGWKAVKDVHNVASQLSKEAEYMRLKEKS